MGLENLFQGLQMFQQGLKEYSTSKAIGEATDAVRQLNESELSEQQKRVAQMRLGNQVALHLGALGAPVSQIQSAVGAIKPEQFGSPEEMMLRGKLEGRDDLFKQGQEISQAIQAPKTAAEQAKMKLQFGYDIAKVDRAGMWDYKKTALAASTKETKAPESKETDFLTNVKSGVRYAQTLEDALNKAGTWEGFRGLQNVDAASKLKSVPYQLAITYAKIKDPGSVVSGKEADKAEEVLTQLGFFASSDKAKSAMNYIRGDIKQILKDRRDSVRELGGKYPDIKSMEHTESEAAAIGRPIAPAGSGLNPGETMRSFKDNQTGQTVHWIFNAQGKPVRLWNGAE